MEVRDEQGLLERGWTRLPMRFLIVLLIALAACGPAGPSCEDLGGTRMVETNWEYHFGLNPATGNMEYFFGPVTDSWCEMPGNGQGE